MNDPAAHARFEPHPHAADIGAGIAKNLENFRVVVKFHSDFGEQRIGILLNQAEAFLVENVERTEPAVEIGP